MPSNVTSHKTISKRPGPILDAVGPQEPISLKASDHATSGRSAIANDLRGARGQKANKLKEGVVLAATPVRTASEGALVVADELPASLTESLAHGQRKNLFGREDLAHVFRRARDLIAKGGVFRLARVTTDCNGGSSLVICNLWRIDRTPTYSVKAYEFDLATGIWSEVNVFGSWPSIPLFPVPQAQTLDWWRTVVRRVVWKALFAAGYDALPLRLEQLERHEAEDAGGTETRPFQRQMTPYSMANLLSQRYVGRVVSKDRSGREVWRDGFLSQDVMVGGAKALRAAIFEHVLDTDLVSAILAVDYKLITLCDYLRYAAHRGSVLRVATEHRNLLPLLPEIKKDHWHRKDLFSRKLWVKDGRKRTLIEYARFSESKMNGFRSLESRSALRWLNKAQLTVVRRWASMSGGCKNVAVLENLSRANIEVKIPAIAWCHIVTASSRRCVARLGIGESAQRLYRAFAMHCSAIWRDEGFKALRSWLKSSEASIVDVADWLLAEGAAQSLPDKRATWNSLQRRSADWHERVAIENVTRFAGDNQTWLSLVGPVVINDIAFTPLSSVQDVALEGYRQKHCVGCYADYCVDGQYRVYTVVEPDGTRSTLGLWIDRSGHWVVEQHRGKYNGSVSDQAAEAGEELVCRYQQAYLKQVCEA